MSVYVLRGARLAIFGSKKLLQRSYGDRVSARVCGWMGDCRDDVERMECAVEGTLSEMPVYLLLMAINFVGTIFRRCAVARRRTMMMRRIGAIRV